MSGDTSRFSKRLEARMKQAAANLEFEEAARLRDDLTAMRKALEKQAVVLGDATDADVFAVADDDLEAAVQVFHVRGGRIRGQRGWVVEKESEDLPLLIEHLLQQVYGEVDAENGDRNAVPREVLVPILPTDREAVASWLSGLRGSAVSVRVPQRGDKRSLMETVRRNAEQSLARHKVARAGDLTLRSQALKELQDYLGLAEAPLRIEGYDVSHVQGTNVVASMVVFEDGLARKGEYRRFIVRGAASRTARRHRGRHRRDAGGADQAFPSLPGGGRGHRGPRPGHWRRAGGRRDGQPAGGPVGGVGPVVDADAGADDDRASGPIDPATGRPRRFAYPPSLVVVDGGLPQVNAAQAVLDELGIEEVAVVGLAKRLEEVWLPRTEYPVILPRTSEGLYLLQRLRDEAHRFAITFHRQRRQGHDGIAARRRARSGGGAPAGAAEALRVRETAPGRLCEDIMAVPGIGPALAAGIVVALVRKRPAQPAVSLTTGEILE